MFEKIIIRRHAVDGQAIDAGLLAETLLFYGHVHILFDQANLRSLLTSIGPENLVSLLKDKRITGTFLSDNLGTITSDRNNVPYHSYAAFQISADENRKKINQKDWIIRGFEDTLGKVHGVKRHAKHFIDQIEFRNHGDTSEGGSIVDIARKDLNDRDYVRMAVTDILQRAVPDLKLPHNWFFYIAEAGKEFISCTNLNFTAINAEYHKTIPPAQNSITPAWLLSNLLDTRADIFFATDYMSEFVTDELHSSLAQLRISDLLKRRTNSAEQVAHFQELNFGKARAVREALNSGDRSFHDFMKLLEKADRFKGWLSERNPDAKLIKEYYEAATSESWANSLPSKMIRFIICTLAPFGLGPVGGTAVGFGDSFLFERLVAGWRPNQFVQGPLKRFVDSE